MEYFLSDFLWSPWIVQSVTPMRSPSTADMKEDIHDLDSTINGNDSCLILRKAFILKSEKRVEMSLLTFEGV